VARSSNVYVVLLSQHPIAAFTVKHECRKWLKKKWDGRCPTNVSVERFRDNSDTPPTTVTLHMFNFPKE
jgi:hypothetical protein